MASAPVKQAAKLDIAVQISAGGARAMEVLLQLVLLMAASASLNAAPFNDNDEPNSLILLPEAASTMVSQRLHPPW